MSDRVAEGTKALKQPESKLSVVRSISMDGLVAALMPFSPPLALFLLLGLSMRRRDRLLGGLRQDRLTLGIVSAVVLVGVVEVIRFRFGRETFGDLLGVLALVWLYIVGEHILENPPVFFRILSRSLGVFALMGLLAYFLPVSLRFTALGQEIVFFQRAPGDPKSVVLLGLPANSLGPLFMATFLLGLVRIFRPGSPWTRVEGAGIALVGLGSTVLMGVRLAVLGMAAGSFIFSFAVGLRGLLLAGLAFLVATAISPGLLGRFENLLAIQQTEASRLYLWQSALTIARRYPLLGVGPGRFAEGYRQLPPVPEWAYFEDPHNAYLRFTAEWGVPIAIVFFGWLFWKLDQVWTRNHNLLRWGAVSAAAAFLLMAFFETYFLKFHVAMPFWLLLGLAQREDWEEASG
ncbi:MAG: O-antigen ligase family protein [Armatimonadota bacterium]|nr:O-antigen ligase family protein [Armatimonadota bacterium]MDR7433612.1 O-antigen ligase family protein [Armatimonadota bacterium]